MTRAKSPALKAAQTTEEALALAERYAALDAEVRAHAAQAQAAIAATRAAADAVLIPLGTQMKAIEKQLQPWWAVRHNELTGGKRRSIELGGCKIGERTTPPKLTFTGGNDAAMVEAIVATGSRRLRALLLRVKVAPEKAIFLKLLGIGDKLSDRLKLLGFSHKQTDEFFIEAIAPAPAIAA